MCSNTSHWLLPASKECPVRSKTNDALVFRMTPPMTVVVEPQGRHRALVVSANLPDENPPRPDDPKVKYFGAGFHRADQIALGDGETLYLAPGAWVEGFVLGRGRDLSIRGSGVLSGACWDWHKGPPASRSFNESGTLVTLSGENITVRDATLFSSWGWTLVMNCVTNARADNVKVLGGRVINDDGIDICRARDVVVRNVRLPDSQGGMCVNFSAQDDAHPIERVRFENVTGLGPVAKTGKVDFKAE